MNILQEIYQHKLIEVRNRKKILSTQEICARTNCKRQIKDFAAALRAKNAKNQNALICEVKKASPSKGIIRADFLDEKDAVKFALYYEKAGAACISVLTDEKYFQGADKYLQAIRAATDLPLLRKDFIVDEYQIYEAKMLGADCILLIVAMLDDKTLKNLENKALDAGLSVLIEVHDEEELNRALLLKSPLIGINNRNLANFKTDINISIELAKKIPQDKIIIAESAIASRDDIDLLNSHGIKCFLIGEHFMRQNDVVEAVREFL